MKKFLFILISLFILIPSVKAEEKNLFDEVSSSHEFKLQAIKPTSELELDVYYGISVDNLKKNYDIYISYPKCNADFTDCKISIGKYGDNEEILDQIDNVKVIWHEEDKEVKEKVAKYAKKLEQKYEKYADAIDNVLYYKVEDLSLINFLNTHSKYNFKEYNDPDYVYDIRDTSNYSNDLKKEFKNSDITYTLDVRAGGSGSEFYEIAFGYLVLQYDGVAYDIVENIGTHIDNIIYIPNNTKNTPEDYIAAAKKRIDDYLGKNDIKIKVLGKISEYVPSESYLETDFSLLGDEKKMGDYYYQLTLGNRNFNYLIIRDSSKLEKKLVYENKDLKTDVSVTTTSPEVPLDTVIQVEKIEKGNSLFQKIVKVLKQEVVQIFDISLHSPSVNKNITKLENGDFSVTVPIDEELRGKNLVAYYIDENNKIEEHPMTVDENGTGTFTTNHFSIYTIAEKKIEEVSPEKEDTITSLKGEEVPKTYDGIINYIILGIVSIISLSFITLYIKKHSN